MFIFAAVVTLLISKLTFKLYTLEQNAPRINSLPYFVPPGQFHGLQLQLHRDGFQWRNARHTESSLSIGERGRCVNHCGGVDDLMGELG